MSRFRSEFLRVLDERGFIHQVSEPDRLDALAAEGGLTAYIGFDATAPSLHVGHMLSIMLLRWLQRTGGKPIALMGGGTTKVGDPSFRDEARPLLDDAAITANLAGIRRVFDRFLDFGDGGAVMVNNDEWLSQLNYIEFLRDYGRHFSVNRMLSFESVKLRLDRDQSLSFLEFNYMILQAYDFVELHRRYGCRLQMGGSDQWGNIINGVDLGRRTEGADLFALTTPLLTTASGAKMGKSASGAVWLNPEMLSAYDFWQFWRNTEDADVGRFLRLFTDLPLEEVSKLERLGGAEINEAKKVLATEVTAVVHGQAAAEAAAETARRTFEEGGAGDALPRVDLPRSELETGVPVAALFVRAGLASSNGEVRRAVANNGIRVNDEALTDPQRTIGLQDLNADGVIKLSVGRKKHALVHPA